MGEAHAIDDRISVAAFQEPLFYLLGHSCPKEEEEGEGEGGEEEEEEEEEEEGEGEGEALLVDLIVLIL